MHGSSKHLRYERCPKCAAIGRDTRGDNLSVFADGSLHCWSCGYHVSSGTNYKRFNQVDENITEQDKRVLPHNFTREVPSHAWKWLLQFGLPYRYWLPFVGWSEKDSRLVFTVGTPTEFSLGRFIPKSDGETNKRKWYVWGDCHQTPHIFGDYSNSKEIVLVEDLISAHVLGQYTASIPLLGTKVFDSIYPALRHIKLPIVIWLDKDQEHTMPSKAHTISLITGLPVRYVVTNEDPKLCNQQSILTAINS